jgi:hypothetical protein
MKVSEEEIDKKLKIIPFVKKSSHITYSLA